MDAAAQIRQAMCKVKLLRAQAAVSTPLYSAWQQIKRFQSRRFAGTYEDLLRSPSFAAPTHFFLSELYGTRDFSDRDAQFARIAGAMQALFPRRVTATAVGLAELHALTESLDLQMAQQHLALSAQSEAKANELEGNIYFQCWRAVGNPTLRAAQLESVLGIGRELHELTRTKSLRMTLRMMRGPAKAAGLQDLQDFLEMGFDTFAGMGDTRTETTIFLDTIRKRESEWIAMLFHSSQVVCEKELHACLAKTS